MSDDSRIQITVDQGVLDGIRRWATSDAEYADILDRLTTDMIHVAEGAAKEVTPVVTGHARRSMQSDVSAPDKVLEAHYPYYHWLDKGEDTRGRKMLSRPGGYGIGQAAKQAAEAAAPQLLDKAGREIAERWAQP